MFGAAGEIGISLAIQLRKKLKTKIIHPIVQPRIRYEAKQMLSKITAWKHFLVSKRVTLGPEGPYGPNMCQYGPIWILVLPICT